MPKFYGMIGFAETVEKAPGIYESVIREYPYYGDVKQALRRYNERETILGDVTIGNRISILADAYAVGHIFAMKYVVFQGIRWTAGTTEVKPPRIEISLREVYNGPIPEEPEEPEDPTEEIEPEVNRVQTLRVARDLGDPAW